MTPTTLTLFPQQLQRLDARAGLRLEVLSGRIWLTRPGDRLDHFLAAGASIELQQDQVLIAGDPGASGALLAEIRLRPLAVAQPRQPAAAPRGLGLKGLVSAWGR